MGREYFTKTADAINEILSSDKGYEVKHTVLTALVGVHQDWYPIFDKYGEGAVQTSFDGLMRGDSYMKIWNKKVREVIDYGLNLSTLSVVNAELLKTGPVDLLDYLSELGVQETSWLPFMLNANNLHSGDYEKYAPRMKAWSDFMIELSEHWLERNERGLKTPDIGQMMFILNQRSKPSFSNCANQTMFLMPNGDFVLPDYKEGYFEYMNNFGNIFEQDFEEILNSKARRRYLRKQILKNNNIECNNCEYSNCCTMEFWKSNRDGDECFGGRNYVQWVLQNELRIRSFIEVDENNMTIY